jgi:hypothetical protein
LGRCIPLGVLDLDAVRVAGLAWRKKYSHIYAWHYLHNMILSRKREVT